VLATEHGVGGARRGAAELLARDPAHAAGEAGLREDRLRELGPGAVALRGDVPAAVRQLDNALRGFREVPDVGGRAALVVDDGDFVVVGAEPQHRANEVVPRRAEEPRRAHDPGLVPRSSLAVELRAPVGRERIRGIRLEIRLALAAVEDEVRGVVDEGGAELCHVPGSADVHSRRALRVVLRAVHVGPGGGVQHEPDVAEPGRRRMRHVPLLAGERARVREDLGERPAELPPGAGYEDAAVASRSDRIGDDVLHRPTTRGSFQGRPCSSGAAGSYSSVTR